MHETDITARATLHRWSGDAVWLYDVRIVGVLHRVTFVRTAVRELDAERAIAQHHDLDATYPWSDLAWERARAILRRARADALADVDTASARMAIASLRLDGNDKTADQYRDAWELYHGELTVHRTADDRQIVSVGLDGRSNPMWRYQDELHLPDHRRSIVSAEDLAARSA